VGEASRLQKESTKANRTIPESIEEAPWLTPQVMGACLMVRAPQGKPIERFDPRYFLYCEDTDLCLRLNRHGIILYVPAARFTHDLGSSSAKDPALGIIRYNRGKELYFRIHHGPIASIVCLVMDRLGALLRLLLWSIAAALALGRNDRKNRQMRSFWRVLTTSRLSPEASSHILE
jgi:GT2 family glycosyltransferase